MEWPWVVSHQRQNNMLVRIYWCCLTWTTPHSKQSLCLRLVEEEKEFVLVAEPAVFTACSIEIRTSAQSYTVDDGYA